MIRKIRFSNFYSFRDETIIDFTTVKKTGSNYFTSFDGIQISKVTAFAGPNNSGKTNVMKVLGFLDYFLSTSARKSADGYSVGFKSFAFQKEKPTTFYIEFETDKKLYFYSLETTEGEVISELLEAKKLEHRAKRYKVFSRKYNDIDINKAVVTGVTSKVLSTIRSDVSVVAFIKSNYDVQELNEIWEYFMDFRTNVNEIGLIRSPDENINYVASAYREFPELKNRMEDFVRDFDLGIEGFSIDDDGEGLVVDAVHSVDGKEYRLPISYESRGTKSLFVELLNIVIAIEEGTVLALDEIETGLHPEAVDKLIQFIVDEFADEKKQFIFTSHSLNYLKRFDPPQMYFVEKEDNGSTVFRLDELDIRSDENFVAKYMSGSYGAFPKIRV